MTPRTARLPPSPLALHSSAMTQSDKSTTLTSALRLTLSPTLSITPIVATTVIPPTPSLVSQPKPTFRQLTRNEARQVALLLTQHLWPVRSTPKALMAAAIGLAEDLHRVGVRWDRHRRVMGIHLKGVWEEGSRLRYTGVGGMGGMELYVQGSFLSVEEEPHPLDPSPLPLEVKPGSIAALPKLTLQAGLASTLPVLPEPALNHGLNHLMFHPIHSDQQDLSHSHVHSHSHMSHLPQLYPDYAHAHTRAQEAGYVKPVDLNAQWIQLNDMGGTRREKGKTYTTTASYESGRKGYGDGEERQVLARFGSDEEDEEEREWEEERVEEGEINGSRKRWCERKNLGLSVKTDGNLFPSRHRFKFFKQAQTTTHQSISDPETRFKINFNICSVIKIKRKLIGKTPGTAGIDSVRPPIHKPYDGHSHTHTRLGSRVLGRMYGLDGGNGKMCTAPTATRLRLGYGKPSFDKFPLSRRARKAIGLGFGVDLSSWGAGSVPPSAHHIRSGTWEVR